MVGQRFHLERYFSERIKITDNQAWSRSSAVANHSTIHRDDINIQYTHNFVRVTFAHGELIKVD